MDTSVSEGWTNGPPPDYTGSAESSLSGPSLLEEGVPENLGHEWREGLGEVLPVEMEEEMEEDSIPRPLWKEIREIGRKRNGQVL